MSSAACGAVDIYTIRSDRERFDRFIKQYRFMVNFHASPLLEADLAETQAIVMKSDLRMNTKHLKTLNMH